MALFLLPPQPGGRLPDAQARRVVASVLLGLQVLHDRFITARNLCLENLLVTTGGHVQISDLGTSKHVTLTKCYTLCGPPQYRSPEMVAEEGYGLPTDVWSVGIIAYNLVLGKLPF